MKWISDYRIAAAKTDRFKRSPNHKALLAAGLFGESGSLLTEMKKEKREREAYPLNRRRLVEELGDLLWYFFRLIDVHDPSIFERLPTIMKPAPVGIDSLGSYLGLGAACGEVLNSMVNGNDLEFETAIGNLWTYVNNVSSLTGIPLLEAANANLVKNTSRWPSRKKFVGFFDNSFLPEEQLPRHLDIEFSERARGTTRLVTLRCNNINFGDQLTDNIQDPDGYRYHDIFHFSYAVYLGWSPVVRALLRCKRKSDPKIDESQDGARAVIIDEAISATIFSRAKTMCFFEGATQVDYELLKTIKTFTIGYEVDVIPLWQWETAILKGYEIFRQLKANAGGRITLDLEKRQLNYIARV